MSHPVVKLDGKPVSNLHALGFVIRTWRKNHHVPSTATAYFGKALEASTDGYIARDVIEAETDGRLTIRHSHEENA